MNMDAILSNSGYEELFSAICNLHAVECLSERVMASIEKAKKMCNEVSVGEYDELIWNAKDLQDRLDFFYSRIEALLEKETAK